MKKIEDKDFIKIPNDFKAVHDLQELYEKINIYEDLKKNLKKYKKEYFDSFVMTFDEVLSYIAEDEQLKYIPKGRRFKTLASYLKDIGENQWREMNNFIVNTVKKEIYIERGGGGKAGEFSKDGTQYILTFDFEHHSPFSRPHNPIVLSTSKVVYYFDVRKNLLVDRDYYITVNRQGFGGRYENHLEIPEEFLP